MDWADGARAAGLADAQIAQLQADFAALPTQERRFHWLAAMNTASPASWASRVPALRGWVASVSAPGGDTALVLGGTPPPDVATAGVTATADNQPSGPLVRYTTTADAGVDAGVISAVGVLRRQWLPYLYARLMTDPSAVTNTRLWVGMADGELSGLTANPTTQHVAAFRYDSGLDVTAYWRAVTCDGTAATVTVTAAAVAADTSYELGIDVDPSGSPIRFSVNGDMVATNSTHLPGAAVDLAYLARLRTLAAAARALRLGRIAWSQR